MPTTADSRIPGTSGRHDALVDLFKEWLVEQLFAQGGLVAGGTP